MLEQFHIKNFRTIKDLELDGLPNIVGLWGKNGAGKSSILQALIFQAGYFSNPQRLRLLDYSADYSRVHFKGEPELSINTTYSGTSYEMVDNRPKSQGITLNSQDKPTLNFVRYFPPSRAVKTVGASLRGNISLDIVSEEQSLNVFFHWLMHNSFMNGDNIYSGIIETAQKFGFGRLFDISMGDYNIVSGKFSDEVLRHNSYFADAGFGSSSFLPIILEAYSFKEGTLLIEEPEISLHPGLQTEVIDFFEKMRQERQHQVLFTSHSDYMLKKLVRMMKEKRIDESTVCILRVYKDSEGTHFERADNSELIEKWIKSEGKVDVNFLTDRENR